MVRSEMHKKNNTMICLEVQQELEDFELDLVLGEQDLRLRI